MHYSYAKKHCIHFIILFELFLTNEIPKCTDNIIFTNSLYATEMLSISIALQPKLVPEKRYRYARKPFNIYTFLMSIVLP